MTTTAAPPGSYLVGRALELAAATAEAAGVRIRPLRTLAEVQRAERMFAEVWRSPSTAPIAADILRAVEHAGGYVVGAFDDADALVGASSGFLGFDAGRQPTLHSHISGVLVPGRGIGLAMKHHQRAWALERGIETITWTFDPLVRRNAWFNLGKLGAVGVEYLVDFYGAMADGLNVGEPSDRLFTRWDLLRERTAAEPGTVTGALLCLDERDAFPWPVTALPTDGRLVLVRLPIDIERLRVEVPEAARAWRIAVRDVLVPAFADGYRATGLTSDGCFLLTR